MMIKIVLWFTSEENKSIKLQSWREELNATFFQGFIEFKMSKNH